MSTLSRSITYRQGFQLDSDYISRVKQTITDTTWLRQRGDIISDDIIQMGKIFRRAREGTSGKCGDIPDELRWDNIPHASYEICGYLDKSISCTFPIWSSDSNSWIDWPCSFYGTQIFMQIYDLSANGGISAKIMSPVSTDRFLEQADLSTSSNTFYWNLPNKQKDAKLEVFNFLQEIIPAPYSIRNSPDSSIWIRLRDPLYPLDVSTFIMYVNSIDISTQVDINRVTNGVEILYNPISNFAYASRVFVSVLIGTESSTVFSLLGAYTSEQEYIEIDFDAFLLNAGGILKIGPNSDGIFENVYIEDIIDESMIKITPLVNSYQDGNQIEYFPSQSLLHLDYYFDIIDDYRPPWFDGLYPSDNSENISVTSPIYFTVNDVGLGVNINSLIFKINDLEVTPAIKQVSDNSYLVSYVPMKEFYYDSYMYCYAYIEDVAVSKNYASVSWRFRTQVSNPPSIINFHPGCCKDNIHTMSDIYFDIFGEETGLDLNSLLITIDGVIYPIELIPKIYRQE